MKIRNLFSKIILSTVFVVAISCGGVNSDARKAASLTNKSVEKTNELKLKEAEKLYKKSQKIIQKYNSHRKSEKFFELYRKCRDKEKIDNLEHSKR